MDGASSGALSDSPSQDGTSSGSTDGGGDAGQTLCAKYGGQPKVAAMIPHMLGAISADCRVNAFFASLPATTINHIADCMVNQVGNLFQCPGVTYAGSTDTQGVACRDMKTAHMGLGISNGDFNALVDDVASGLMTSGVDSADIASAAPALMGMQPDIVENQSTAPTKGTCDGGTGDGGTSDGGTSDGGTSDGGTGDGGTSDGGAADGGTD
jgi:hypothetical protein